MLEVALRRDRAIMVGGIAVVVVLAWLYILRGAGMDMTALEMSGSILPFAEVAAMTVMRPVIWTPAYATLIFFMWWVMMVAMMVPSAAPTILLFATVNRRQREQGGPFVPSGVFAAGYILAWGGFSLLAASLQWGLERIGLLSTMMASTSTLFGGLLLVAAGLYQLTPLKHACLRHCRSPIQFVTRHWRTGRGGAMRMGLEHGAYCLGCCWPLMALLFVGGVMNLYWIAGLALFVLLEKTVPAGHRLGRLMGAGLIAWGGWLITGAL